MTDTKDWAREQLASADFGDVRRVDRAIAMLGRAAEHPAGQLTQVFHDGAELQAAYDFVEGAVPASSLVDAFADATLDAASQPGFAYVVIDGTSLTLTDRTKRKDFGSVGSRSLPTRGLKVIDAIGLSLDGVPLGLLDLHCWARGPKSTASRFLRRRAGQTEVRHWVEVIEGVRDRVDKAGIRAHLVIDREGDCAEILRAVGHDSGESTIRAAQRQRVCAGKKRSLWQTMKRRPISGKHFVHVPKSSKRRSRTAVLDIRHARVVLDLPDRQQGVRVPFEVTVVWAKERGPPFGDEPLEWMLLTSDRILKCADAIAVIDRYCLRWRVEDFHRTWKRGRCCVEDSQLHDRDHVVRWATMLAAVALRVERLKHLARTEPDAPATVELSLHEVNTLREAKRRGFTKRTERITDDIPNIRTAVRWIARMGGFHGKEHVEPGAMTIGRGLQELLTLARGAEIGLRLARK